MDLWNEFSGPNAAYVLELYERFRADPQSVDPQARAFFEQNPPPEAVLEGASAPAEAAPAVIAGIDPAKIAAAHALAQAIRHYGHWAAQLDPLGSPPPGDPALLLETYGLNESDLRQMPASVVGGAAGQANGPAQAGNAWEAVQYLRGIYSGKVGHDYLQIRNPEEREWLRDAAESNRFNVTADDIDAVGLLDRMTQVEAFEQFLQRSFVAKTRFSIEGLDMMVPMLDEIIGCAAESGIYNILIGMAHRGRLNVLAHILNKPIEQILAEFKDPLARRVLQNEPTGFAGDVKYHAGGRVTIDNRGVAAREIEGRVMEDGAYVSDDNGTGHEVAHQEVAHQEVAHQEVAHQEVGQKEVNHHTINLTVQMAPNPSHLEAVNPVVEGMARAAGTKADQPGPSTFDPTITLPIVFHGDAAFPGQGVVAETMNMYRLPGYETGGTIHIIANNQIGFTTPPGESRSTLFASDLAKGYRIPVIHVNADDPEGVIVAARIAFAYRARFQNDFLIDLIGYRRLGHNEGDEPAFTQPEMYQRIEKHPSVRQLWADRLAERGQVSAERAGQMLQERMAALQSALEKLNPEDALIEPIPTPPPPGAAKKVKTSVPDQTLRQINQHLARLPEGFTMNPRLAKIQQRREKLVEDAFKDPNWPNIDWAKGEELAFATILADGVPIRLTGQDVERGTFSHRHAVLHDAANGATYAPLQHLPEARAAFDVFNSPLSEYAALGFEFGYDVQAPERLTIWEAQYGDFINNAQTVVDEFVVSARDKWGQLPSLVMLLPHGWEGQGPDHSSGRLERFLNLAPDGNLRVANCTTAANYFHLLRRQAATLKIDPLPLIVMTPKSLLRHPLVSSPLRDFTEGSWQPVIDRVPPPRKSANDSAPGLVPAQEIRRLILCSGKIYVDLITSEVQPQHPQVGIARLEQLAPFPMDAVRALLDGYPNLDEVVWVQEEPRNMGAWDYLRPYLEQAIDGRGSLQVISRPASPTPAEGSNNLHTYNQRKLVEEAFERKENKPQRRKGRKVKASL